MKETVAFRALGSADRQILLHEILRADGEMTVEELARQVAARRHRISPESVSEKKRHRARIRLVHHHLPMLREFDIIEQDGDDLVLVDDETGERLLDVAEDLDSWPPEDPLQTSPL